MWFKFIWDPNFTDVKISDVLFLTIHLTFLIPLISLAQKLKLLQTSFWIVLFTFYVTIIKLFAATQAQVLMGNKGDCSLCRYLFNCGEGTQRLMQEHK